MIENTTETPRPEAENAHDDAATHESTRNAPGPEGLEEENPSMSEEEDRESPTSEEATEAEIADVKDQLLRTLAELENTRKRAQREKQETAQFSITKFARELLGVVDNLDRALAFVPDSTSDNDNVQQFHEGVSITQKELYKVLEKFDIKEVAALDTSFDPNLHQAMVELPCDDKPAGTVIQEMQKGFTISGRLLRPALVGVAKAPVPEESS